MKFDSIKANEWLGRKMFLLILFALTAGLILKIPDSPCIRFILMALFAYMTFVTTLGTSLQHFTKVLLRPWIPLWALLLIHVATPLLAWLLGNILYPDAYHARLGLLVGAAVPAGITSVIWAAFSAGNVPLTLTTVTLDTLIVPFLLPAYYHYIVGQAVAIDYTNLLIQLLLMVTLPSIAGMLINDWSKGKIAVFSLGSGGISAKLAFFIIMLLNGSLVAPGISWSPDMLQMLLVAFLMVVFGYLLGYAGFRLIPGGTRDVALALVYSVGLRNISCGLVIAVTYFPPAVAVPIMLCMFFQQPLAAIVPHIFQYMDTWRERRHSKPQPAAE
ncbi:MAG TPA: bile acid:sodium symporter [Patescibacteria group bacterium]|nr:bile acid:sodium symporter [Patescibacteria group bacterium]